MPMFFRTITVISFLALGVVTARAAPHPIKNLSRRATVFTFGGKERQVGLLSDAYQVYKESGGRSYAISAGYEDVNAGNSSVPAVLVTFKRPRKSPDGTEPEARVTQNGRVNQMKDYATLAGQFLAFDETDDKRLNLVLRNPQKNFPTNGSSELKMFHELYLADQSMNTTEKLTRARELGHIELMRLAKEKQILYKNYGIKSALIDSGFTRIVFFDWEPEWSTAGPSAMKRPGIVELPRQGESRSLTDYETSLKKDNKGFTFSDLNELLNYEDQSLRDADDAAFQAELAAAKAAQKKAQEDTQNDTQPVAKRNKRLL